MAAVRLLFVIGVAMGTALAAAAYIIDVLTRPNDPSVDGTEQP